MAGSAPVVYILQAEDEFAAAHFLQELSAKVGKGGMGELNTQRLDGRQVSIEQLREAALAIPFMVERRLVIVDHALSLVNDDNSRKKFIECLMQTPPSTALVLVEYRLLSDAREREQGRRHWLEIWAEENKNRAWIKEFPLRRGAAMTSWILQQAKEAGGSFEPRAAERLAEIVGDDSRLAENEIQKLLNYVDYARPVEIQDVDQLAPYSERAGDFALVNALRQGDGRTALKTLRKMLADQDAVMIFFSLVHQFRQILLARLALDEGQTPAEITKSLSRFKISAYPARLAIEQAQKYDRDQLEGIVKRLLDIDIAIKSGEVDAEVALETLVAALTNPPAPR
ncbi:MAG: DNA polymerase III subunit delta [Chloroflexota bacterium]